MMALFGEKETFPCFMKRQLNMKCLRCDVALTLHAHEMLVAIFFFLV